MYDTNKRESTITGYDQESDVICADETMDCLEFGLEETNISKCFMCGHEWTLKGPQPPARCPKCRSTRWNNPDVVHNKCKRCGHGWVSNSSSPNKCPKCQSPKWNEHRKEYPCECRRCYYSWKAIKIDPVKCPRCKSSKWNEPLKEYHCPKCGRSHMIKSNSRPGKCPVCDPRMNFHRCVECGHSWKRSRGQVTGKCPSCNSEKWCDREAPSMMYAKKEMARTKLFDLLQSMDAVNVNEDLAELLDIEVYQADVYMKYMGGETPVRISMDLNISFEHTMDIINRIGDTLRRF